MRKLEYTRMYRELVHIQTRQAISHLAILVQFLPFSGLTESSRPLFKYLYCDMLKLHVLAATLLPISQSIDVVVNCDALGSAELSVDTSRNGELEPLLAKSNSAANVDCQPALPLLCVNKGFCDVTRKNFWAKKVRMCVHAVCACLEDVCTVLDNT